ncbi:MAG: DUF1501 domain-containing protein [Bryobacterales bacterium]|nr:DUF1501 domain-containing protein [Bryobacterales bacterium]
MTVQTELIQRATRRHFLSGCQLGLASMYLRSLRAATQGGERWLAPKKPHFPAKAKSVIYLHMAGGPSQLELFDPKPELQKHNGSDCPQHLLEGKRFAFIKGVPKMLGTPYRFLRAGQSGTWVSELLPHFAEFADQTAIVRSMTTREFNHAPAQLLLHTGSARLGSASMGAWATYGLGTENQDLPGFVVLVSGNKTPSAGKSLWGSGFLPSVHQGVQCRTQGDPVLYLGNPEGMTRSLRRLTLDALADVNRMDHERSGLPDTLSRIQQYELAFRMQVSVPEVMDISREPDSVHSMYGTEPGKSSFANNCLLARRLVENGVRFVQLYDWGWDHHGTARGTDIRYDLPERAKAIDRPTAALVKDLDERGLLEETLVVWGGEFGRTPMRENRQGDRTEYFGRDHHPFAFTMWLAGGGIKGGRDLGSTDDIGFYVHEDPVTPRDLQATILHLLGLDPFELHYLHQGLKERLIGPAGEARVLKQLL